MLLMSYGSWDNAEELGTTEVSTLPTGTSPSSCHRCWRVCGDREKLLPSSRRVLEWGWGRGGELG